MPLRYQMQSRERERERFVAIRYLISWEQTYLYEINLRPRDISLTVSVGVWVTLRDRFRRRKSKETHSRLSNFCWRNSTNDSELYLENVPAYQSPTRTHYKQFTN